MDIFDHILSSRIEMKLKDIISCTIIIVVVILIRTFIVTPIKVNGDSMVPTLTDGNLMILKKFNRGNIKRGDIVVVKLNDEKIIKRVIGLPKEDIKYKDNVLYINDKKQSDKTANGNTEDFEDYCREDEYFVMGDNRAVSYDSRKIGCIKKDDIMGNTNFIFFPISKIGKIK